MVIIAGVQGDEIGDVKFNGDGDGVGRYSVYQYQHIANGPNSKYNMRQSGALQHLPVPAHR
jgi:hypothetical protein